MKKALFVAMLLVAWGVTHAQTISNFSVQANCPITITTPLDSTLLFGAATITTPGDAIAGFTWKQTSGSPVVIAAPTASQTTVRGLTAGVYTFSMTVTTKLGALQTIPNVMVTVLPAPPPPRTVKSVQIKLLDGTFLAIPLTGITIMFSDGKTQ